MTEQQSRALGSIHATHDFIKKLQLSKGFSEFLLRHLQDAFFLFDSELRILACNEHGGRLYRQRTGQSPFLKPLSALLDAEARTQFRACVEQWPHGRAAMEKQVEIETIFASDADEGRRQIEQIERAYSWNVSTLRGISERRGHLFVALGRDVTEKRRLVIELEASHRHLERLAAIDELCGIPNRRHFNKCLGFEWNRLAKVGQPLSLVMIDVDYFKRYNDKYGHPAGDTCLRSVAQVLASCVTRSTDLVARYGGEEFVLLLPSTPQAGADRVCAKIGEQMRRMALPHAASDVGPFVSLSCGIATLVPRRDEAPNLIVELADEALYEAKRQGRARHVLNAKCDPSAGAIPGDAGGTRPKKAS